MGNSFQNEGLSVGCNQAGPTCINVTSGNDPTRWYNKVAVGLRFQQAFGAVDFKAYGYYSTAGKEKLTTAPYSTRPRSVPRLVAAAPRLRYDNLSFYKGGVAVTAMNLTLAADYIGGRINGQLAMSPSGGVNTNAELIGLTYANGPITLGAEVGIVDSQGDARLTGLTQRHEYKSASVGLQACSGRAALGDYRYTHRHQGGFDFATNTLGQTTGGVVNGRTNDAKAQGFLFATVLPW